MKKINRWLIFLLCVPTVAFAQQNSLLQKYRSMALDYNHDLKAADKNIAASIELEKAAQKDLRPKLSGEANFQYTGNPLQLNIDLPSMQTPLAFEGRNMKYGASLSLLQPVYTGGRLLESIRMAKHQQSLAIHQADYFRSILSDGYAILEHCCACRSSPCNYGISQFGCHLLPNHTGAGGSRIG